MGHPTAAQAVTDQLRDRILAGNLEPGSRIDQGQLVQELGVSLTPVRDAVRRLTEQGLIELIPRRGAYVRELTLHEAIEITELRELLEAFAFRRVAPHITDQDLKRLRQLNQVLLDACDKGDWVASMNADEAFHQQVAELAGNRRLADVMRKLSVQTTWFRLAGREVPLSWLTAAANDHSLLVGILASRDPDAAEAAIRRHVRVTHRDFIGRLREAAEQPAAPEVPGRAVDQHE